MICFFGLIGRILMHPHCPDDSDFTLCSKLLWIDFIYIGQNAPLIGPSCSVSPSCTIPSCTIPETTRPIPFN